MKNVFNSQADANEIKTRIEKLKAESPAKWGKMNANEMLVHLTDQLRLALGEKESKPEGPAIFRTVLGYKMALYIVPWRKGKETSPTAMNKDINGTKSTDFSADQNTLLEKYALFLGKNPQELHPHPMFGKFGGNDWGRMVYKHFDHHLRQFGV